MLATSNLTPPCRNPTFSLPNELVLRVFQHLDGQTIAQSATFAVNDWTEVAEDPDLWRAKFTQEFPTLAQNRTLQPGETWKTVYIAARKVANAENAAHKSGMYFVSPHPQKAHLQYHNFTTKVRKVDKLTQYSSLTSF